MIRLLALAALAVAILASPATAGGCVMSYCQKDAPSRAPITNNHRQVVGDLYDPGHGRPIQIRNNSRQILGTIEQDGSILNTRRQPVGSIESLGLAVN